VGGAREPPPTIPLPPLSGLKGLTLSDCITVQDEGYRRGTGLAETSTGLSASRPGTRPLRASPRRLPWIFFPSSTWAPWAPAAEVKTRPRPGAASSGKRSGCSDAIGRAGDFGTRPAPRHERLRSRSLSATRIPLPRMQRGRGLVLGAHTEGGGTAPRRSHSSDLDGKRWRRARLRLGPDPEWSARRVRGWVTTHGTQRGVPGGPRKRDRRLQIRLWRVLHYTAEGRPCRPDESSQRSARQCFAVSKVCSRPLLTETAPGGEKSSSHETWLPAVSPGARAKRLTSWVRATHTE